MELLELHRSLIEINSTEDISEVQEFIVSYLQDENEQVKVDSHDNIIATKGSGQPHYVLNTHFDTVPPHIEYNKDGDIISGRGASDAKGPLAVFLKSFVDASPTNGKLTIALTPDEETAMTGAFGLASETLPENPTAFIIGEPTDLDVCTSSKGYFEGEIEIEGISAHSSEPQDGCNAISVGADVIKHLQDFDAEYNNTPHPELGPPVLSPTLIEGGEAINQIPASCTISFSRRGVPPETEDSFMTNIQEYVEQVCPEDASVTVSSRFTEFLQPFDTADDSEFVESFTEAGAKSVRAFTAATEASVFAQYGVPIVVFGPGYISDENGAVAHSDREYVPATQVLEAESILKEVLSSI